MRTRIYNEKPTFLGPQSISHVSLDAIHAINQFSSSFEEIYLCPVWLSSFFHIEMSRAFLPYTGNSALPLVKTNRSP